MNAPYASVGSRQGVSGARGETSHSASPRLNHKPGDALTVRYHARPPRVNGTMGAPASSPEDVTCKTLSPVCNGDGCIAGLPWCASGSEDPSASGVKRGGRPSRSGRGGAAINGSSADGRRQARKFDAWQGLASVQRVGSAVMADAAQVRTDVGAYDTAKPIGDSSKPAELRRAVRPSRFREPQTCPDRFLPPATCRPCPAFARRHSPRRRIVVRRPASDGGCAHGTF